MQKRILGYLLTVLGFLGMGLAGYIFVTGSGDRGNLFEVICYMIVGAACFFYGINSVYESAHSFSEEHLEVTPEPEDVSPIQQQWRTIYITPKQQVSEKAVSQRSSAQTV